MKKYILYARAGSTRQTRKGASIEYQIQRLQKYGKENNLQISETITEIGSGADEKRYGITAVLNKLSNRLAQGVLCVNFDRLSRSLQITQKIWQLIKEKGVEIITPNERYTNDSDSELRINILTNLSEAYRQHMSESIKRGLRNKKLRTEKRVNV